MQKPASTRLTKAYLLNWLQGYIVQRSGSYLVENFAEHEPEIVTENLLNRIRQKPTKELVNLIAAVTAIKSRREMFRDQLPKLDKECLAQIVFVLDSIFFKKDEYNDWLTQFIYYDKETEDAENLTLLSEHLESLNYDQLRKTVIDVILGEELDLPISKVTDAQILRAMKEIETIIAQPKDEQDGEDN